MKIQIGQIWSLWVYDDSMKVTLKVKDVRGGMVMAVTEDGLPCVVSVSRLIASGKLIEDYRMPFEPRKGTE